MRIKSMYRSLPILDITCRECKKSEFDVIKNISRLRLYLENTQLQDLVHAIFCITFKNLKKFINEIILYNKCSYFNMRINFGALYCIFIF